MSGVQKLWLFAIALLSACSTEPSVESTWGSGLAQFGIDPVYPPNAMLAPGAIDIVPQPSAEAPKNSIYERKAIRIANIDMRQEMADVAKSAPYLPTTTDAPAGTAIWRRATTTNIYAEPSQADYATRAPLYVLPGFNLAHGSSTNLSAIIPIKFIIAAFGGGYGRSDQLTISVPAAEFLTATPTSAYAAYYRYCTKSFEERTGLPSRPELIKRFEICHPELMDPSVWSYDAHASKKDTWLYRIIYQVIYARSLKFHYADKSYGALLGSAKVASATSASGQAAAATNAAQTADTVTGQTPATSSTPGAEAQAKLAELVAELKAQMASQVPGGSIQITGYSAGGVDLEQVFEDPVAIGFKAMYFTMDGDTKSGLAKSLMAARVAAGAVPASAIRMAPIHLPHW